MTEEKKSVLNDNQRKVLKEFYGLPPSKVIFTKSERDQIWDVFKSKREMPPLNLEERCPALYWELNKALESGNRVQSAVFSECVYAQTLANMLGLTNFFNYTASPDSLPETVGNSIASSNLRPRYIYKSRESDRLLIQAGGNAGVDSALVSINQNETFAIEFKEPGAKTSEFDLPAYGEDGQLVVDQEFLLRSPQFVEMLGEQLERGLNFWDVMGSNVNAFSAEAIRVAVSENYSSEKYADVICVEDKDALLTMLPAHEVGFWSNTQGEIRPAGRNAYRVWTPKALENFILEAGGRIESGKVIISEERVGTASRRGGGSEIGRYKINPLFFVKVEHVKNVDGQLYFSLDKVKQLKPTIAAKMFFTELEFAKVQRHYRLEF